MSLVFLKARNAGKQHLQPVCLAYTRELLENSSVMTLGKALSSRDAQTLAASSSGMDDDAYLARCIESTTTSAHCTK